MRKGKKVSDYEEERRRKERRESDRNGERGGEGERGDWL
jgi:hypothetical protein